MEGLVGCTYFRKVPYILLTHVTVRLGKLPHLKGNFQFFPEVSILVRIYAVQLHYKIIYFDIHITIIYILI